MMAREAKLEEAVGFAENPEPRCPCVLLLDTSGSMQGAPTAAPARAPLRHPWQAARQATTACPQQGPRPTSQPGQLWAWAALLFALASAVPAARLWAAPAGFLLGLAAWRVAVRRSRTGLWLAWGSTGLSAAMTAMVVMPFVLAAGCRPQTARRPPTRTAKAGAARTAKPPANAKRGDTWTNPADGAVAVYVPAGEFLMGSPSGEGADHEHPQHKVYLDGYWIYQHEVTVAQYRKFCQASGRDMPEAPNWGWKDDHPIVKVSCDDATAYAKWAGVALPTEAQWEKAARGTDGRKYPWGNEWDGSKCANSVGGDWGSLASTKPVGSYRGDSSPYGARDMAGNVWEWCADWYDENYYKNAPNRNPTGPTFGKWRVVRGGGWGSLDQFYFRCAVRDGDFPGFRGVNGFGFRCRAQGL